MFPEMTVDSSELITKRLFICRHGETAPNAMGVLQGSGIDEWLNENVKLVTREFSKRNICGTDSKTLKLTLL
jgi:hypothetical protein